jgi:hypothetical protein
MSHCTDFHNIEAVVSLKDKEITGLLRQLTPPRNDVKYWFLCVIAKTLFEVIQMK